MTDGATKYLEGPAAPSVSRGTHQGTTRLFHAAAVPRPVVGKRKIIARERTGQVGLWLVGVTLCVLYIGDSKNLPTKQRARPRNSTRTPLTAPDRRTPTCAKT